MKVAIVGSRTLFIEDFSQHLENCDEIISGRAVGIDTCAEEYAKKNNIAFTKILPEYNRYGRGAPIIRNKEIVDRADYVLIFWDGHSKGTAWVINYAKKTNKDYKIIQI